MVAQPPSELRGVVVPRSLPLRESHRRLIRLLGRHVTLTRTQLAERSGLPATTISHLVKELTTAGIVTEERASRSPRPMGRPERDLRLVGPKGVLALLAQSHSGVRIALGDFDGHLRHGFATDFDPSVGAEMVCDRWVELLRGVLEAQDLTPAQLAAVVISLPLPVRPGSQAGTALPLGSPLPLLTSQQAVLEAVTQLGPRLQVPVLAENDADLGALGEAIFGAGSSADSIVYLKLIRFLGAGLVIDGKLHTGARGMAGELAHVSVVEHGARCFCGGTGCLGIVLGPRYQQFLGSVYGENITLSEAMERADGGDLRARSAIEEIGRLIGRPLSALCTIIDPVAVVLDGNLGKTAQYLKTGLEG